jgi:hypothetical protein
MNPLESRKQLLIAESELNRVQLMEDWKTMAGEAHALTDQARTARSMASALAALAAGLTSLRHKKSTAVSKPSWLQTVLKSAGLVSDYWQRFRNVPAA